MLFRSMEVKGPEKNKKKQYHEFEDNSAEWDIAVSYTHLGKSTQPGLHPSLPRYSEEPSGDGKHLHEYRFEYAGTR